VVVVCNHRSLDLLVHIEERALAAFLIIHIAAFFFTICCDIFLSFLLPAISSNLFLNVHYSFVIYQETLEIFGETDSWAPEAYYY
jgi:hypothetical protein